VIRRRDAWPLGALGFIVAVTASWWALALWSAPGAPEWLERARSVCFNITESGLPDAGGWLLLVGQPLGMIAILLAGWGHEVRESLAHLGSTRGGRTARTTVVLAVTASLGAAAFRVANARVSPVTFGGEEWAAAGRPRLDMRWPTSPGLVDQGGGPFDLRSLRGRPAMVTFAFGHCQTVCPAIVHAARVARQSLSEEVSIVVFTLDPWRDTPSRLPVFLSQLELDPRTDHVVGGSVGAVEAALDAWGIGRQRNERTGDIVHPALVYLVTREGAVAFASTGAPEQITILAERLGWRSDTR